MKPDWKISEEDMLRHYGAEPTPGSGVGKDSKLDGVLNTPVCLRIENKFTKNNSFRLDRDLLKKSAIGAMRTGDSNYIIRVDFNFDDQVVIMPERLFLMMLELLHDNY